MRHYSPGQIELLIAFAVTMTFAGVWFPLVGGIAAVGETWLEIPAAAVPLLLFAGVLLYFRSQLRD